VKVAALYDIHGNLPALEAVLREDEVAGADVVVVGGDVVSGPMGRVRFCHAAPGSDEEVITRATPGPPVRRLLRGVRERVVVCGHTHIQFDRTISPTRVVNVGSVGAPYEARPGAYWLTLRPTSGSAARRTTWRRPRSRSSQSVTRTRSGSRGRSPWTILHSPSASPR
jgi:diadenosine tetraphosphatase ApaH/serine/threonine PP2A family protein phosphatase